ncbi:FMN-binding glutamate synthase family protein [uncultured Ferrimonas sp.]|uniref:FMN-binding glutamate synthase family protein n=1 Tax=uncultured Ferrimonas sp. TaxID=432640 RepID=UPI00261808CA|nr:FMN-binding glutamate synthase family protein [uncultured Ferrimonas sp.]
MTSWASRALELSAALFIFFLGSLVLLIAVMYVRDVTQTKQALRRNYPVVGRFRYWFEHMGEFFRQYFFAQDREEMPFNRAQRSWVYRAAKNIDSTVAFGSTRPLNQPGDVIFLNCLFPTLKEDSVEPDLITFGDNNCPTPYQTRSFFNLSAMSFGALSVPAVQALSHGAKQAGIWMNTGEGGLSPYHLEGGCDLVFQIGTAKYGVRDKKGQLSDEKLQQIAAHPQVRLFELKLSQGAKPGKGGILPGEKVTDTIAAIRGITAGEDSISPNGHPEIRSVADLLDMVAHIRTVTGKPVGFKVVLGGSDWLAQLAQEINQRGLASAPDFITLDSADGGTGAAPQSLMDYMGLPIKRSLPQLVAWRQQHQFTQRIRIICSGKLVNPSDVAWALCVGADVAVSARGFMFALGCIQALQCNKNSCPTGITTHDPKLQKGLVVANKSQRVAAYASNLMHEVGVIAHSCGVKGPHQLSPRHAQIINDHGLPTPLDQSGS